jgi:UTP-glucose-1-phosphate uridylyltransferase
MSKYIYADCGYESFATGDDSFFEACLGRKLVKISDKDLAECLVEEYGKYGVFNLVKEIFKLDYMKLLDHFDYALEYSNHFDEEEKENSHSYLFMKAISDVYKKIKGEQ